jgi:hypothetical protein
LCATHGETYKILTFISFSTRLEKIGSFIKISGFHHDADEISFLLGYNGASSGNPLQTFQDNILVPSSMVEKSMKSTS